MVESIDLRVAADGRLVRRDAVDAQELSERSAKIERTVDDFLANRRSEDEADAVSSNIG